MPVQILMPALSPTMTEGNLVKWLKNEGDTVKAGEVLAEIETDKATMEVEAVDEGTLARIVVPAGTENVAVNSLIALLLEEDEDPAGLESAMTVAAPKTAAAAPSAPDATKATASAAPVATTGERVFASPLAKRLAEQGNIDLKTIAGSGPKGRVVKADVEATATRKPMPAAAVTYGDSGYKDISLNNMRKVIAKRLTQAKQEVPHFYLTIDCELDALLKLRAQINARLEDQKISVNDFIVRASALALMQVPEANSAWLGDVIRQYDSADVAVAVAIDSGLVTPIVRSAHLKSLKEISAEVKQLADKARAGKLMPEDYQGGSFTISNLGMFGIKNFSAILNPPQACILAVGAGEKRPVVRGDSLEIATVMTCTLSVDHRAVDGALGARLLAAFKELIEDPLRLVI